MNQNKLQAFLKTYGWPVLFIVLILGFLDGLAFYCARKYPHENRAAESTDFAQIGITYYQMGRYGEAASQFEMEAAKNPGSAEIMYDLGNSYFQQKKFPQAVDAFQKALALKPGDADTQANLRLAQRGVTGNLKNFKPAPPAVNAKGKPDPKSKGFWAGLWYALADCFLRQ